MLHTTLCLRVAAAAVVTFCVSQTERFSANGEHFLSRLQIAGLQAMGQPVVCLFAGALMVVEEGHGSGLLCGCGLCEIFKHAY